MICAGVFLCCTFGLLFTIQKKIMFELTLMVLFLFAVMAVFMLLAVFVEFVNDRFR